MFKAELVCFEKGTTCQAYRGNEFQELSFVGSSYISEEDALEDAYRQAFEKYGITSDEIKRTKTWHSANYQRKLDDYGFGTLVNNQHSNNESKAMTKEERNQRRREMNALRKQQGLKRI